jgi:predicted phage tail component-like protein
MNSYFIFKEIHSDDMVRVENLPPIVKPPKRYNIKEIDGNNNIGITVNGYKAYEKAIKIWFKEDNVQDKLLQVMDWLDGAGELILSNEPDKYYNAFILDQIDYERAIRYRTATVKFLVQPYKYALYEEETTSRTVINQGNTNCLPLLKITGNGQIAVRINGVQACNLLMVNQSIVLDGEEQEAYKETKANLQNRIMIGKFPELIPGINEISFSGLGTVTDVKTLVRSRWL